MLRYKTETRPGLVALYNIRPGNGAGQFLQPWSPHGAQLPIWVQHSQHDFSKSCSIWILFLPLAGLPLILPSIFSCKSLPYVKTWPIHRCFFCQMEFSICLSSFTFLRTSSLLTLSSQLMLSYLLHIHVSKASNLLLSVCVNVYVSAA